MEESKGVSVESLLAVFDAAREVAAEGGSPDIYYQHNKEKKRIEVQLGSLDMVFNMYCLGDEWEFEGPEPSEEGKQTDQVQVAELFAWGWRVFSGIDSDLFKNDLEKADLAFKQYVTKYYGLEGAAP